jgi:tetratricopeptide (TPR) repeat protein
MLDGVYPFADYVGANMQTKSTFPVCHAPLIPQVTVMYALALLALPVFAQEQPAAKQEVVNAPVATAEAASPGNRVKSPFEIELDQLYGEAWRLTQATDYEKALPFWEKILTTPPPPGARPPSLLGPPFDLRGVARWNIAEIYRSQGRWQEALALYQENRKTSPLDDGCVPSGLAFQRMAVAEGICLENLGRTNEAVELYWPAALYLQGGYKAEAMRRLVDLYSASGQLNVLTESLRRERAAYTTLMEQDVDYYTRSYKGAEREEVLRTDVQIKLSNSSLPACESIIQFRTAARDHNWKLLLDVLQEKSQDGDLIAVGSRDVDWRQNEAYAALLTVASRARPALERAARREPDNIPLHVALWLSSTPEQQAAYRKSGASWVFPAQARAESFLVNQGTAPPFPQPGRHLKFPTALEAIYKVPPA